MKNLFMILILILTGSDIIAQNYDFDLISVNDLKISKSITLENTKNESISLGDPKTEIIDVFGNPDNTKLVHWEIRDEMVNTFIYLNSTFSFLNDTLRSFYIKDPDFVFKYNDVEFKVGDQISSLSSVYPISYNNRYDNSMVVYFGVEIEGEMKPSVVSLYIEFNSNEKVTGISRRSR